MADGQHILISLAARHAEKIFRGEKLVELRRRPMRVAPGTTVWIYVKSPVGSIVGRAKVDAIHTSSPATLWRRFKLTCGLSRSEFFEYFDGAAQGFALVLEGAQRLQQTLTLARLRQIANGFQPPQFFTWLTVDHRLFKTVVARE